MLTYFLSQNFSEQKEGSGYLILRFPHSTEDFLSASWKKQKFLMSKGKNKFFRKYVPAQVQLFPFSFLHSYVVNKKDTFHGRQFGKKYTLFKSPTIPFLGTHHHCLSPSSPWSSPMSLASLLHTFRQLSHFFSAFYLYLKII